jgi:hypothetical protein
MKPELPNIQTDAENREQWREMLFRTLDDRLMRSFAAPSVDYHEAAAHLEPSEDECTDLRTLVGAY